jgi:putative cardiolipin synthase
VRAIRERRIEVTPETVRVVSDPPDKVLQPPAQAAHAVTELADILAAAKHELILVSPYFVPGESGARWLEEIARRGVKVRVLTNSYRTNDVTVVHAGYAVWRSRLLKAGIELYELKPDAYQRRLESSKDGTVGRSKAALHAKTYVADRETIFVGSLNLDPRSARLNTEMGLALTSAVLSARFAERFDANILDFACRVELGPDGATTWRTRENGVEVVRDSEPGVGWWQRISVFFATLLPVESQL